VEHVQATYMFLRYVLVAGNKYYYHHVCAKMSTVILWEANDNRSKCVRLMFHRVHINKLEAQYLAKLPAFVIIVINVLILEMSILVTVRKKYHKVSY
jgi:hypothetical protein